MESSFIRHDRGVGVHRIAKVPRQDPCFSIVASLFIFLSPGFAVILSNIFTLSVTLSWSENRERHRSIASCERCYKWFSRALLAAMLFSRSVDSCFHVFVGQF